MQNKSTKEISELKAIISDSTKLSSSLANVMNDFDLKKHFSLFDFLKCKGLAVSSLLNILIMLPFYTVENVYAMFKAGINNKDLQGKKDAYYDIKNNEHFDWRTLLNLHANRFKWLIKNNINLQNNNKTALIFDDTLIEKTGKKIERVSVVNDHVSIGFVLGFKLLVCGFWDGASFIPIDFSLHREKGHKQDKLRDTYKKVKKEVEKTQLLVDKTNKSLSQKKESLDKSQQKYTVNSTKTNKTRFEKSELAYKEIEQKSTELKKELLKNQKELNECRQAIKRYYAKEKLFGLTCKERQEQFRKNVSKDSYGNKRRLETDMDKISSMIAMLKRAVKNGFIVNYVLCDSWFFCYELLETVINLKKGVIKLISMVKINNQIFTDDKGKKISVKRMPEIYHKQIQECRKLKSKYIKIACFYQGIRVNIFFVKMGKSTIWHLLLTTDLELGFIKLMETYQIRWSIEVYFKESKQYLNLESCKSSIFDAHIADITISMMQHIMLSYFKRLNYMQSIGELFKDLRKEHCQIDLVTRLLEIFWELVKIICEVAGFDFFAFQEDVLRNDKILNKFIELIPQKTLDKAA